jgi:steroid 5-alpha reductase family enzyme
VAGTGDAAPGTLRLVHPLEIALGVWAASCAFAWIASLVTKDTSWVDREWSLVPIAYVWIFALAADLKSARLVLMALLVTAWGARLTFNFARKGGYSGVEDYRWVVLRSKMSPAAFQLFNLGFIVLYQNALLLLISLPALTAYEHRSTPLGPVDLLLAAAFLAALLGETIADQQQWDFQQWKRAELAAGRSCEPGFITDGLFRFSRHPNFFFEQLQWWLFFGLGAAAAGTVFVWTGFGALLLSGLFLGSTRFTEQISASKYPAYDAYRACTSMLVPWPPRDRPAELSAP